MAEIILSQGQVTAVDDCDSDLNRFAWKSLKAGQKVYAARQHWTGSKYITVLMHRVIAERAGLRIFGLEVDHRDRDGLNNRRSNLFAVDGAINAQNSGPRSDSTTGVRGVSFHPRRNVYQAEIQVNKRRHFLGYFRRFEDAVAARLAAEERYYKWRHEPRTGVKR